jgi:hypothetical protein
VFCKNYPIERKNSGYVRVLGVVVSLALVLLRRKLLLVLVRRGRKRKWAEWVCGGSTEAVAT